ncbi:MAG: ABC transporter permease [Kiritimatiellia bacterium]|nr:ABC transporter permease [Kiritimatiellia bacterium]
MRTFAIQWRREVAAYFGSPLAYAILAFFLLVMGGSFLMLLSVLAKGAGTASVMSELFGSIFFWLATLITLPLITMRLVAEERRTGTLETLMTAPVRDSSILLAKFAGALTLWIGLWVPTLFYVYVLRAFSARSGIFDAGALAGGYLGVLLVGGFFISLGLLASTLTRNQVAAAMAGFAPMFLIFLVGFLPYVVLHEGFRELGFYISPVSHMLDFSRGMLDTRAIAFYGINTWLVLWLCVRTSEARKGR